MPRKQILLTTSLLTALHYQLRVKHSEERWSIVMNLSVIRR